MTATITRASADEACRDIVRRQAPNFRWGIELLPPPKRRALSAVYAMARRIDDVGDGSLPPEEKLTRLSALRHVLQDPGGTPTDPVAVALANAVAEFSIPLDAFADLVTGCEHDVEGRRYDTIDDLVGYCRLVAGSIGRLSLAVFAPTVDEATMRQCVRWADDLGVALQLTNVLRDVREDLVNGRVYLPARDLAQFECTLELDPHGSLADPGGALADLLRFEAARALAWYDRGLRLVPVLDRRSASCCAALAGIYADLLSLILRRPQIVLRERASLPGRRKAFIAARALARPKGRDDG